MLLRASKLLALIAAVQILGGHWMALQSIAWVGMAIDYSKDAPLTVALEKTFDGDHPCGLCEKVSEGRTEEQTNDAVKVLAKFEAVLAARFAAPAPAGRPWIFPPLVEAPSSLAIAPPTPPPLS